MWFCGRAPALHMEDLGFDPGTTSGSGIFIHPHNQKAFTLKKNNNNKISKSFKMHFCVIHSFWVAAYFGAHISWTNRVFQLLFAFLLDSGLLVKKKVTGCVLWNLIKNTNSFDFPTRPGIFLAPLYNRTHWSWWVSLICPLLFTYITI